MSIPFQRLIISDPQTDSMSQARRAVKDNPPPKSKTYFKIAITIISASILTASFSLYVTFQWNNTTNQSITSVQSSINQVINEIGGSNISRSGFVTTQSLMANDGGYARNLQIANVTGFTVLHIDIENYTSTPTIWFSESESPGNYFQISCPQ